MFHLKLQPLPRTTPLPILKSPNMLLPHTVTFAALPGTIIPALISQRRVLRRLPKRTGTSGLELALIRCLAMPLSPISAMSNSHTTSALPSPGFKVAKFRSPKSILMVLLLPITALRLLLRPHFLPAAPAPVTVVRSKLFLQLSLLKTELFIKFPSPPLISSPKQVGQATK